jgi:GAF domain-containing protein/HAMP domain-containing protein
MRANKLLNNLLFRTGGWYLLITFVVAQIITIPGALLGIISIQMNAEFTNLQLREISAPTPWLIFSSQLILLFFVWLMSQVARKRMDAWKQGVPLSRGTEEEIVAWKEITGITWRYGLAAFIVLSIFDVALSIIYSYSLGYMSYDQAIYSLMGGTIAVISTILLGILFIDWMLIPVRNILTPMELEAQLHGRSGIRLASKFLILISTLIVIGILMIGPIGYKKTVTVLYEEIGSAEVLYELQFQSIVVSLITLALGGGLAYAVSRSISDPIRNLTEIFRKVDDGDLTQRAQILATDETAEVAIYFNHMIARLEELHGNLEKQVTERTAQLQAMNEVSRVATTSLNPDEVVAEATNIIVKEFGFNSVALYLSDSSATWLDLKVVTGPNNSTAQKFKSRQRIDRKSLIGRSVLDKKAQVPTEVDEHVPIDVAFPLMAGNKVLGAFFAQTNAEHITFPEDMDTLQSMANQIAIGLENARLFQETDRNLQEMQSIHKKSLQTAWNRSRLATQDFQYSVGDVSETDSTEVLSVPLILRDQEIGKITLESQNVWEPEDRAWVEAVALQAAMALENARLIEEGQAMAMRERLAAEISGRIWHSTTMDGVLQTALQELGSILDASEATIELKVDP